MSGETGLRRAAPSRDRTRTGFGGRAVDQARCPVDGDGLHQASVLDLPFPEASFDVVFSHGALHHVPDIHRAQREIRRVLKPGGELVVMLYARWSLNYLVSIGLLRRAALLATHPLVRLGALPAPQGLLGAHLDNARRIGLARSCGCQNSSTATPMAPTTRFRGSMTSGACGGTSPISTSATPRSISCVYECAAWGGTFGRDPG
ncbi:class I SAM-dependent methyltransferase [Streptomyces sp. NPDC003233]